MKKIITLFVLFVLICFESQGQVLSQTFEGTFPPTGWANLQGGSGNLWSAVSYGSAHAGTGAAEYKYNSSNAANAFLITTGVALTAGNTYTITYWENTSGNYVEKLQLTVGMAQTVAAQTTIIQAATSYSNSTYAQITNTYTPTTSGTYYFAWNCVSAKNKNYLDIDDIVISAPPACTSPIIGTVSSITANSASIPFTCTSCSPGNSYVIEYGASGFTPGTAATAGTGTIVTTTSSPVTLSGLAANTTYDVYVRQNCTSASNGYSANSAKATFTTLCNAITSFPFTETFDAGSSSLGCFSVSQGTGASYFWAIATADATHGVAGPQASTRFAYLDVYDAQTTYNPYYLNTPSFALDATAKQFSYYYFLGTSGYKGTTGTTGTDPYPLTVQISTNGGTTWVDLYNHSSTNSTFATTNATSNWTLNTISLAAYVSTTIQLRFKSNSNYGTGICNQAVDQLTIANIPACISPTLGTVTAITAHTASVPFTCTSCSPGNAYIIEYGASGFTPGTGATAGSGGIVITTGTSPVALSGLTSGTAYDVYVRQNCTSASSGYSSNSIKATFTTLVPLAISPAISATQQATGNITKGSTNNNILSITIPITGTSGSYTLSSVTVNSANTNDADITTSGVKLWTGTSTAPTTQIGSSQTFSGGVVTFSGLATSITATTYLWITYDISATATIGDLIDAQIPAGGIILTASGDANAAGTQPASLLNPSGNGTIAVIYCTPVYTSYDGSDYIANVTLNTLNNTTSATPNPSYTNYCPGSGTTTTSLTVSSTYTISLKNGTSGSEHYSAYIDFNNNGSFTDAGEQIVTNVTLAANATTTATFTVPSGAFLGVTRLRVIDQYNTTPSPCPTSGYGEAEDYCITIAPILPTIISTSPISSCVGQTVTITGTNFTNPISSVTFGGVAATSFAYVNATTITATVPAGAVSGAITVTEASGSGTSSILYGVYTIPAPTASNNGPICSGTAATLIASGLAPGGTVGNFTATTGKSASITSISNSFTMEFWVKPGGTITLNAQSTSATTGLTGQQYAVAPTQSATNGGVGVSVGTNGISVYEHGNSYLSPLLTYTFPTAISNWINVAVVYTSRTPSLYINGSKVATGLTSVFGTNSYPSIGSDGTGGYNYGPFTGLLDNYRLWNGSLTQAEIVSVMFNQNGTTSKTKLAQYTFNANTVTDSTGTNPTWNIPSSFVAPNYFTYTWTGTNAPAANTSETQTTTGPLTANQSYTVTASIGGSCTSASSAATTVIVTPPSSVASVTGTTPLCIGGTATYTANSVVLSGGTGAWSSSNMAVATINAATGLVTAVAAGTTNIIYTITGGCGGTASAQQSLTVSPNVTAGTVSGTSPLCIAATATYSSTGTAGGTWSSTNTAVATVDVASGLVTGVAAGTTNITYTVSSGCGSPASAFKTLTVSPTVTSGTVSGTTPLCIGASATYTSNGTAGGTWTSNNTAVATVNASTGVVTAIAAGNANIRYTITSGCGSPVTSAKALTVSPNVTAGTVSGNSPLCIGTTTTYTTTGTTGGTWSSTNTGVATVNATSGLVTALAAGTTDITYTVNSGCGSPVSAFQTLTVSPNVTAATVSGTSPLCQGSMATYTTTGTTGGTWSSTNTSVATVNATSGVVTALASGTTNITYTVNSGCGSPASAFKSLTVNAPPSATIAYSGSPYCSNGGTATVTRTGTAGGTYTSTSGLSLNSGSGAVTLGTSTPGTYTVTYTVAASGGCTAYSTTTSITIAAAPSAAISYSGSPYCSNGGTATVTRTGTAGGTYTSTSGLSINSGSGAVALATSTPGTYTITYTIAATGSCAMYSTTASITISTPASATISYAGDPYCANSGTAMVTLIGTSGGTYSSPDGLTIDPATGSVDLSSSANSSGTYTVYYDVNGTGGCSNSSIQATTSITIMDNIWTGNNSTSWDDAGNWTCGIPTAVSNIIIPATNSGNYPVVSAANSAAHDVIIQSDASLTTAAPVGNSQGILTVTGAFINEGTFADSGRLVLGGSDFQTFPGTTGVISIINQLEVNNTSAEGVAIDNSFAINGVLIPTLGTIDLGNNDVTLHSDSNYTARVAQIPTVSSAFAPFNYGTGRFRIEQFIHNPNTYNGQAVGRSYRLMTAPVASTQTIKQAWQDSLNYNDPYIPGQGTLITGPGGTANGFDGPNTNPSLKYYNSSLQLVSVPNTNVSTVSNSSYILGTSPANQGYFIFVRGDRNPANLITTNSNSTTLTATGKLQTGNMKYTAPTMANAAGSYVLLANPYASPIDFDKVYTNANTSNISRLFYAFNPKKNNYAGGYNAVIYANGVYSMQDLDPSSNQTQYVQSNQAVFVTTKTAPTGTPTIGFDESEKSATYNYVFRPSSSSIGSLRVGLLYVTNNSNIYADGALVQYNAEYSDNVDDLDAVKLPNPAENIAFLRSAKNLSVERRNLINADDTVFLNLWNTKQKSYYFNFTTDGFDAGLSGFLVDSYLKTSTPVNMSGATTVNFSITADAASKAADRFMIVFRPSATLPVTFTKVKAYQQGSNINVEWNIENEVNIKQYEVERSTDGRIFSKSITLTATRNNGTTAAYSWPDASPVNGANYYRIKSISKTGEVQYSLIVKVTTGNGRPMIAVYPNPVTGGTINLQLINQPAGKYGIRLMDKIGKVVIARQTEHSEGSSTETLQVTKAMAHGAYQLEITRPDGSKTNINVLY